MLDFRSPRAAATALAAALAALALAPQAASASASCNYDPAAHAVHVELAAPGDTAAIARAAGGAISLNGVACGGATVVTTDSVDVTDYSGGSTTVELDAHAGAFAPGYSSEASGAAEIEFSLNLGAGFDDHLTIHAESQGGSIALGDQKVNLNYHAEQFAPDSDVSVQGADQIYVIGSPAHDWLSGQGGGGTGQPFAQRLILAGVYGDDVLLGGGGDSFLYGGPDDDVLIGGAYRDVVDGGAGDDTLGGGDGTLDEVSYQNEPRPVSVDLALTDPQETGAGRDAIAGFEAVAGSQHDDVLHGTGNGDTLFGNAGDDLLDGRGGTDSMQGGTGDDTLRGGAGNDGELGGDGTDVAAYDDASAPVTVDLALDGKAQATGGGGVETLYDIEGVAGSPFDDHLTGSAGADTIAGGGGADTIDGHDGADVLGGGPGIDAIESRDNSVDSVSCGEGPDSISADPIDKIDLDCSPAPPPPAGDGTGSTGGTGTTTPPPVGGTQQGGSLPPVLSVRVPHQSLRRVRAAGLRVLVGCSATCTASGRLRASRRTARRLGLGASAKRRTLGRLAPVALDAGATRVARVVLTSRARRALRRVRSVRLALRLGAVDGAGRAAAPVSVAVRLH